MVTRRQWLATALAGAASPAGSVALPVLRLPDKHSSLPAMCVIAWEHAHGHELLHVILGDIHTHRAGPPYDQGREVRVDWLATRMWLLGGAEAVREAAGACAARLAH